MIHGYAVHDGVGAGEVNVFKQAGVKAGVFDALAGVQRAVEFDEHGFACLDVALKVVGKPAEYDVFGGDCP